eukprot:SAG11_NODE_7508_length_1136_cov_1.209257_2_plen_150_part_00
MASRRCSCATAPVRRWRCRWSLDLRTMGLTVPASKSQTGCGWASTMLLYLAHSPRRTSPNTPKHPGQLRVVAPPRNAWPQKVFVVKFKQLADRPAPTDATPALNHALSLARKAGGGVVYLPPGTYTITGGILLPANTILKGAGANRTWL